MKLHESGLYLCAYKQGYKLEIFFNSSKGKDNSSEDEQKCIGPGKTLLLPACTGELSQGAKFKLVTILLLFS